MSAVTIAAETPALDDRDAEPRTPMKRLGSTRKLAAFNNIRAQLTEQTRVLEARAEATVGVAGELHDYCRRRADLENEYAKSLEKLARYATQRHRDQKHKRTEWQLVGAFSCWQTALEQTRALARDHSSLAELYGGRLASRTQRAAEDAARLHRKCKDIVLERHEEVGSALAEAATAGKARAAAAAEWRAAAAKLRHAYEQRERVAQAEPTRQKKLKATDKELEKRRQRHSEARARALRARADYVLCLEAANATLQRYYLDDIAEIMLCMEVGFECVIGRVTKCAAAADLSRATALSAGARALTACACALDASADRQRVLDHHPAAFTVPRRQLYQGIAPEEEDAEVLSSLDGAATETDPAAVEVGAELATRLVQLETAARALRAECRERAKTLDAAEAELLHQMEGGEEQWEISTMFGAAANDEQPPPASPADAPRKLQEDYYLSKFRSYVCAAGRLARLESKAATLRGRLVPSLAPSRLPPLPPLTDPHDAHPPDHRGRSRMFVSTAGGRGQFAAPLDEHLAATRRPLPLVLTSCVRVIATYGLRHQGIFRVSGSQVEMQSLRAAFERGADPLCNVRDATDINSVAGLLKLYLRELRPPLFPPALLERVVRLSSVRDEAEFIHRMQQLLLTLPKNCLLLMRYLFAFLAHLAEYSDENMMDAWNLAICLGPTLLAARGEGGGGAGVAGVAGGAAGAGAAAAGAAGGGQVATQNLVNELVKRLIVHHEQIFPQDISPHALYRREDFIEPEPDAEGEAEAEAEASCSGSDENGVREGEDEGDGRDDLSLYDDDDDEDDDDISDEVENGDWTGEQESAKNERCSSAEHHAASPAQVQSAAPPAPLSAGAAPPVEPDGAAAASGPRRLAEATPDLVLDLPSRAAAAPAPSSATPSPSPSPAPAPAPASPAPRTEPADSADTFLHNRDTLKKRPAHHKQTSSGDSGAEEASADDAKTADEAAIAPTNPESPVPARNTARVAAKFADLTLTGGSLKPALAAKPALLRRPTPHPHHATAPAGLQKRDEA